MISPFIFKSVPQIIFGPTTRSETAGAAAKFGSSTLLITGGSSFKASQYFQPLITNFKELGVKVHFATITDEPSPNAVDEIVDSNRGRQIDSVIAIGGGSVLDGGKAVAAMLEEDGSVQDYLEGVGHKSPSGRKRPFLAVPTTSGTGSETTANAVLSLVGPGGFKKSLRHNNFVPDIAIVDPELTLACPASLTANCGMDCFTQLVEGYLSTNSSPLTDSFALQGIEAISRSLELSVQQGENIAARTDLAYAAMLSGIVLANAGLGTVHGFASAIGGVVAVPHGLVCGTLMEPANRLTLLRLRENDSENGALAKYTKLGKLFSDKHHKSSQWYQDHFISTLSRLTDSLEVPDFSSYQLTEEDKSRIIAATGNKNNPVQFMRTDLEAVLDSRCS